jgi:hypothetical protein
VGKNDIKIYSFYKRKVFFSSKKANGNGSKKLNLIPGTKWLVAAHLTASCLVLESISHEFV